MNYLFRRNNRLKLNPKEVHGVEKYQNGEDSGIFSDANALQNKKEEQTNKKMEFTLAFPIEEDMVNLGSWLLLYHPKFFTENIWGHTRFFFWLVFS